MFTGNQEKETKQMANRYETQLRSEQLADSYLKLARANHYMLGLVEAVTLEELDTAEQILITKQNTKERKSRAWGALDLALDLLDNDRTRFQRAAHPFHNVD